MKKYFSSWIYFVPLLIISGLVSLPGCRWLSHSKNDSPAPSFVVVVNRQLKPTSGPLPLYPDGAPRPIATLTDKSGKQVDFVENELMVSIARKTQLDSFLKRWHGTVLAIDEPRTAGIDAAPMYLVRVQTEFADLSATESNLRALNPGGGSPIIVNNDHGKQLIALAAAIARTGIDVGMNYLTKDDNFQDQKLNEAAVSSEVMLNDAGMVVENWDPNPFNWNYMKSGGSLDIGVAPAWRVLDRAGSFKNKIKIAVIGGGFGAGTDFPAVYEYNKASFAALDPTGANDVECSGGSTCRWHGWNVVNAAMGQVNNGIGAAGPAGPVAELLAIRRSADIFNNIQFLTIALLSGAKIINMSFGARVPATLSFTVIPFNLATKRAYSAGKILVASAGNAHENIDEEDCVLGFCWESAWWTPAENAGVIAVGAMNAGSPFPKNDSNYGDDDLDIWAPGSVWVSGDYDNNKTHVFSATSAAAPNLAGTAALIWAADPGLSNEQVINILYETAHKGTNGEVVRWPNMYAAAIKALKGTPPDISIRMEPLLQFGSCEAKYQLIATVTDPDGGIPKVTWTSDIAGVLGTGDLLVRTLPDGTHHITATAVDGTNLSSKSNKITVEVKGSFQPARPTINIISFSNHQHFTASQEITFEAGGLDPNKALGGLVKGNVRWVSSRDGDLGAGQRISRKLSVGAHYIYVYYTGTCGGTADDFRLIEVTSAEFDGPPNMHITTPSTNDLVVRADPTGQACIHVAGFGFDEEDKDFATIEWWETDRSDLQWKVLSFDQNTEVCLKLAPGALATTHKIRLRGKDSKGHIAYSSPLIITVLPTVN